MTEKECRRIIREQAPALKQALVLSSWRMSVTYVDFSDEVFAAEVSVKEEYEVVEVRLDASCMEDEVELLDTIRHELLHCLTPNYVRLKKWLHNRLSLEAYTLVCGILEDEDEKSVRRIEKVLDLGLGSTPARMVAKWKDKEWGKVKRKSKKKGKK